MFCLRDSCLGVQFVTALPGGTKVCQLIAGTDAIDIDSVDNLCFSVGFSSDSQLDLATFSEGFTLGGRGQRKTTAKHIKD